MDPHDMPIIHDLDADGGEMLRLLRLAAPPQERLRRGAFVADWNAWIDGDFREVLGPLLVEARHLASLMQLHELIAADKAIDERTGESNADRSRSAGRELLELVGSARHARQAILIQERAPEGVHLATAFGVQAAVYHIHPPAALLGYLYTEWAAARAGTATASASQFVAENACVMDIVRKILSDSFGEFANASCA